MEVEEHSFLDATKSKHPQRTEDTNVVDWRECGYGYQMKDEKRQTIQEVFRNYIIQKNIGV